MAEILVKVEYSADELVKALETFKRSLFFLKALAALTPTRMDDQALDVAEQVLTAIEPFVKEPWFASVFNFIYGLIQKGELKRVIDVVKLIEKSA